MRAGRAVLAASVLLALPTAVWPQSPASGLAYLAGLALVVAALTRGARQCRGRARTGWTFVAAAAWCWLVGDTVQRALTAAGASPDDPGPADVLWLTSYPLLVAGVVVMLGGRELPPRVRRELRLDVVTVTSAVALGAWQLLIAPEVADSAVSVSTVLAVLYPLGDVVVFTLAVALLLAPGRGGVTGRLLVVALGSTLMIDIAISVQLAVLPELDSARLDAALLVVNALFAVAVLHPDREVPAEPVRGVTVERMRRGRVLMLGVSLVTVSVVSALPGASTPVNRILLLVGATTASVSVLARFLAVVRERENAEARLTHQAHHDSLTGLANRSFLVEHLRSRLADPVEAGRRELALFYIDLDGFKRVNDERGHAAGDAVLRTVAERLVAATRQADVVARLGGDEFVVLAHDVPASAAHTLAEKLFAAVREPILLDGTPVEVGASVGVYAPWAEPAPGQWPLDEVEQWLRTADAAMYSAKQGGGGVVLVDAGAAG